MSLRPVHHSPRFIASFLLAIPVAGALACERVPLVEPAPGQTLAELQPTLTWRADVASRHRVQVAVVLPEARVVAMHDIEVIGNRWRLPEPMSIAHASVKVIVSRHCSQLDTQDLLAQAPAFFVDARTQCAVDRRSVEVVASALRWAPVANASRYSVRTFKADAFSPGGPLQLAAEMETQQPQAPLNFGAADENRLWSIQAMCNGLWGRPIAWRSR